MRREITINIELETYDKIFDKTKDISDTINNLLNGSDGYHTFDELYHQKAILFSVICNQNKSNAWKSKIHADNTMYDKHFIAGVNTPKGQYTFHFYNKYWDLFNIPELEKAPIWDGHKPEDIDRLLSL